MKKRYLLIFYIIIFAAVFGYVANLEINKPKLGVLICKGKDSYAYHRTGKCDGLGVCSPYSEVVSEDDAIEVYERRPCKICYSQYPKIEVNKNDNQIEVNEDNNSDYVYPEYTPSKGQPYRDESCC